MEKKRVFQYDFMRVIFMLMVLGVHVMSKTDNFSHQYNRTWYIFAIAATILRLCNPLFFMLSGRFNLNKDFTKPEDYKKFYKKRAISILLPFIVVSIIAYIDKNYRTLSILNYGKQLLSGKIEGIYWFLYTLIGIMIFTPFFAKMMKSMSNFEKKLFLAILFFTNSFITIFAMFKISNALTFTMVGIAQWHLYYFAGYLIEDVFKTKKSRKIVILLGILGCILQFLVRRFMNSGYQISDPNPILTLQAFGLYFLLLDFVKIKNEKVQKIISYISQYSFIFYLLHMVVLRRVCKLFTLNINSISNMMFRIYIFIITFIITLILSILIDKIVISPIKKILDK